MNKWLRDPLLWLIALFLLLLLLMPYSGPLFARWFPQLDRPVYQQESFFSWRWRIFGWWRSPAGRGADRHRRRRRRDAPCRT